MTADAPQREKFLAAFAPLDGGPASISPDGRHVAYYQREKGEPVVFIVDLASVQTVFRVVVGKEDNRRWVGETSYTEPLRITFLRWADNRRVVVATSYNHFFVLDHVARTGRHLVNLNGEEVQLWSANGMLGALTAIQGRRIGRVVTLLPSEPAFVFIEASTWQSGGKGAHRILKINVETGKVETSKDEEVAGKLIYDTEGGVRGYYGTGYVADPVFLRKPEASKEPWQRLDVLYPVASSPPSPLKGDAYFGPRAFPIAVAGDLLYFASNLGRSTVGLYALNLQSGKQTPLAIEDPSLDLAEQQSGLNPDNLVVERTTREVVGIRVKGIHDQTRWLDPELAALQATVERKVRGSAVTIVDWDNTRNQFVVEVHGRADPGAYLVFTRSTGKLQRVVPQRATRVPAKATAAAWSLQRPDGHSLSGWLTLPDKPTQEPTRAVVVRLSGPWFGTTNATNFDVIALSQMGYAVLEVNHRGVSGLGTVHLRSGRQRIDEVAAEDILIALDALAPKAGLDRTRVALFGTLFGGYLALRTAQLHVGRFTCAVTIEPATDLELWTRLRLAESSYHRFLHEANQWFFGSDKVGLRAASPATDPDSVRVPVFIAANPDIYRYNWSDPKSFRRKLIAAHNPPTFVETTAGVNVPGAEQARLWEKIEDFLGRHLAPTAAP